MYMHNIDAVKILFLNGGREGGAGKGDFVEINFDSPTYCGTSLRALIAALKNASPAKIWGKKNGIKFLHASGIVDKKLIILTQL